MSSPTGITTDEIRDAAITDPLVSPSAAINEHKFLFDLIAGHNHNGVNSRLVSAGGTNAFVVDDSFTGAVNGINDTYTMSVAFLPNTVACYIDGIRQKRGPHFNEVGSTQITFTSPPSTGETLVFDFVSA